jgi:hypothetical protein
MNDSKSRILVKVKEPSSNSSNNLVTSFPVQMHTLDWIYISRNLMAQFTQGKEHEKYSSVLLISKETQLLIIQL